MVFQESFKGSTRFKDVSRNLKAVYREFQGCFKEVSIVFQGSIKTVSSKFKGNIKGV